jgi:serine/threonine protein kinase
MNDDNKTRISKGITDGTRLTQKSDLTRITPRSSGAKDEGTRIAQEANQKMRAVNLTTELTEADEFYKIGDKIGNRYEVVAIHRGAMGVVYGCYDHHTNLARALKTVRSLHSQNKEVHLMFEEEAAVWISLEKHPYIVRAYLVERFNKLPYVITDYVRGPEGLEGDLRGWLGHPRLTLNVAVEMALQIAQGMQHAVRKIPNLVHRDLKPANILVNGDGKAMVTDFGLVNVTDTSAGTPAYMSPEQWCRDLLDSRSDIYAFGCILFEMLTAHRLFPATTDSDWENAHLKVIPSELTSLVLELPHEIDQFVRCCLEKNASSRPQSWDEVVAFFARWYHLLTGKAVVLDFSSLELNVAELLQAGHSLNNLKRYDEAIQACNRAIELDANSNNAWASKANYLNKLNRYDEALIACDKALCINPDDSYSCLFKGISLYNLKRYDEALLANDKSIELNNNNSDAFRAKGTILYKLNRLNEAFNAFDYAFKINPTDYHTPHIKSLILRDLKRFEETSSACDQVLAIEPDFVDSLQTKANSLYHLKRHDEAISYYKRVLIIEPNRAESIKNICSAFCDLKDINRFDEGIMACDRALSLDPNNVHVLLSKSNMLYLLKRYNEAIICYNRVLTILPDRTDVIKIRNQCIDLAGNTIDTLSSDKDKEANRPWYSRIRFWD